MVRQQEDKVPEIDPWIWAKGVKPEDVTDAHVLQGYHLDPSDFPREMPEGARIPTAQNPFWLRGLGEMKWLKMNPNQLITEGHEDYNSQILDLRKPKEFAGLTNSGATCYANSILQALYHNPLIKKPILQRPIPSNELTKPALELQKLFAKMDYSQQKAIDTVPFIQSLNLNIYEQQDAQEFAMLFTEKLIRIVPDFKDLFEGLFQGVQENTMTCKGCENKNVRTETFTAINLELHSDSLEHSLVQKIIEEEFTGDNLYSCSNCNSKQEAVRGTTFTKLPPVLQLQIMRYGFNLRQNVSQKLKRKFEYPDKVDLQPFVNTENCATEEEEIYKYTVYAALLHYGGGANHGHYAVRVRDATTGTWREFSDENIDSESNHDINIDEEIDSEVGSQRSNQIQPAAEIHSSADVYMLIYIQDTKLAEQAAQIDEVPPHILELKEIIKEEDAAIISFKKEVHTKMRNRHVLIQELFESIASNQQEVLKDEHFLSLNWIQLYLKEHYKNDCPVDNSNILCPHNKLMPPKPYQKTKVLYRVVPRDVALKLYTHEGGGPQLDFPNSLCRECVQVNCEKVRREIQLKKDIDEVKEKQKEFDKVVTHYQKTSSSLPPTFLQGKKWVRKSFFSDWKNCAKQSIDEMTALDSKKDITRRIQEDVVCSQGGLKYDISDLKLIPEVVWNVFEKYFTVTCDLSADNLKECPHCKGIRDLNKPVVIQNVALSYELKRKLSDLLTNTDRPIPGSPGTYFIVPYKYIEDLKKFLQKPDEINCPTAIVNETLLCTHSKLGCPVFLHESEAGITNVILAEWDKKLVLLSESEWEVIQGKFSFDKEISITVDEENNMAVSECFCKECGEKWWSETYDNFMTYKDQEITIIIQGPTENTQECAKKSRNEIVILAASHTPVYEFRRLISKMTKIPAGRQRLLFNNTEIIDDTKGGGMTLRDFGIYPQCTMVLQEKPEDSTEVEPTRKPAQLSDMLD